MAPRRLPPAPNTLHQSPSAPPQLSRPLPPPPTSPTAPSPPVFTPFKPLLPPPPPSTAPRDPPPPHTPSNKPPAPPPTTATTTLKAIATATNLANSAVTTGVYTIQTATAASPTFNPAPGTYASAQQVTISSTT